MGFCGLAGETTCLVLHALWQVPPAERTVADEQAAKLDAMMELTLEHLKSRVTADTAAAAWSTLLAALERTLLPTQRSKFTQFLLFYLARQVRIVVRRDKGLPQWFFLAFTMHKQLLLPTPLSQSFRC
jgi:hypothetical protein